MSEPSFQITCPSCETVFEIVDPELIGQIVACPKCGGMMMVKVAENEETSSSNFVETSEREIEPVKNDSKDLETAESSSLTSVVAPKPNNNDEASIFVPPVQVEKGVEVTGEERQALDDVQDEGSGSSWYKVAILVLSGLVCALILTIVIRLLFVHSEESTDSEVQEVAVEKHLEGSVEKPENVETDKTDVPTESEESSESEEVLDLNREQELANSEFDSRGVYDLDEVVATANANEGTTVELNGDVIEDDPQDENEKDGEITDGESEKVDIEQNVKSENGEESIVDGEGTDSENNAENVDEGIEDLGELPTEFDEDEFNKANSAETDAAQNEEENGELDKDELSGEALTTDVSKDVMPSFNREIKTIDLDKRLSLKIRAIEFPTRPVAALRLLSEMSNVPIEIDLEHFELLRTSFKASLELKLEEVTVGEALDSLANALNWDVQRDVEKGKLVVRPKEPNLDLIVEESFEIGDLLESDGEEPIDVLSEFNGNVTKADENVKEKGMSPNVLEKMIRSLVEPESWGEGEEDRGSMSINGDFLTVRNNACARAEVLRFLNSLRTIRGLEPKNGVSSASLIPETLGWKRLTSKKTPLNYLEPAPLQQVLNVLEISQDLCLFWDDADLNESGVGRDSIVNAHFDSATLEQILTDLLGSLKMSYVILDEELFVITSKKKAEDYKTVEFYLFERPTDKSGKDWVWQTAEELTNAIVPKSWNVEESPIWFDETSDCWIIRREQPVQREIRRWTEKRGDDGKKKTRSKENDKKEKQQSKKVEDEKESEE